MAVQETITSAVASLLGSTTGMVAGLVAAAALWLGIDYLLSAIDINLPLRQFMFGRNLNALGLYGRYVYAVVGSYPRWYFSRNLRSYLAIRNPLTGFVAQAHALPNPGVQR